MLRRTGHEQLEVDGFEERERILDAVDVAIDDGTRQRRVVAVHVEARDTV